MDDSDLQAQLEKHHLDSYGWALNCCSRDPSEAEDVLQTVYLKILQGKARYDGQAAFKTWLFAVIRRTAADVYRGKMFRNLWLLRYGQEREHLSSHEQTESAGRTEIQSLFQKALAALPKRQREVLQLVFYHDLSVQQASEVMGVSVGSARTHYERGKQRLRDWLKGSEVCDAWGIGRTEDQTALQ